GATGLWAAGDCAAVPDGYETGNFFPPTAQHGMREAITAAKNIEAGIERRPLQPFVCTTLGQLATIGRRTGVAMIFGFKFSGLIAWGMWRSIYLMKLPRLAKKLRVMMDWGVNPFFGRDIEQMVTLRDIEAVADQIARIRARAKQSLPATETVGLHSSTQPTLRAS